MGRTPCFRPSGDLLRAGNHPGYPKSVRARENGQDSHARLHPSSTGHRGRKKKRSKVQEYPGIHWDDLDNPLVRTADAIYSDAVNLGRWLREAEGRLYESEAPSELIAEFVGKAIRLELCYDELRSFSKTGEFKGKHPFIAQRSERDRVMQLLREDPVEFTKEMHRIEMNITRYSSHVNSAKLSTEKKKLAQSNLEKFQASLKMYEEILKTVING